MMATTVDDVPYDPSKPFPKLRVLYSYPLKNVPGFSALCVEVTMPPGGATPPHRHGGASVVGLVTKGTVYNKMNTEPTQLIRTSGAWYEAPGCHHKTSANASEKEESIILATYVIETRVYDEGGPGALIQMDEEWAHLQHRQLQEVVESQAK